MYVTKSLSRSGRGVVTRQVEQPAAQGQGAPNRDVTDACCHSVTLRAMNQFPGETPLILSLDIMTCEYVPQDVCDHVIDFLADDKQSLSSCALVCRDWRPRSQYHFFADITLIIQIDSISNRQMRFEQVLRGRPEVALHVRSLTVLAHLQVHNFPFIPWPGQFPVDFSLFPRLRALTLDQFLFDSPLDFLPIMRSIPSLEELCLKNVWLPRRRPGALPLEEALARIDLSPIRPLRVLRFSQSYPPFAEDHYTLLAVALHRTRALRKLTTLELLTKTSRLNGWFSSLPELGKQLIHLSLYVADVQDSWITDILRTSRILSLLDGHPD